MGDEAAETVEEGVETTGESPTSEVTEEVTEKTVEDVEGGVEESADLPKQPKHADAKDRIQFLVRENKTKETILVEKDRRISELEQANAKKAVDEIAFPQEEDFESTGEFHKAMSNYNISVFDAKEETRRQAVIQKRTQEQKASEWDGFFDRAEALPPNRQGDIAEAIQDKTMPLNATMQEVFKQSEVGPELVDHFYRNKDLARNIASMPMLKTVNEMNKIAENLIKAKSSKDVTTAPSPATPVSGSDVSLEKDQDKMSIEEWSEWDRKNSKVY